MLKNKSILFIAPVFHDYHTLIIKELEEMGARVVFCPERDYSIAFKIVNNFMHRFLPNMQAKHYDKIIDSQVNVEFDYLFVIRGYMITADFINKFRTKNPNAKLVMYQWDSNNTNNYENVVECFDTIKSFDYEDCARFDKVEYLPLFYTNDVLSHHKEQPMIYDFLFMGTYLPERYEALIKFKNSIESTHYTHHEFIYIPKTSLIKERIKKTVLDINIISTNHIPRKDYLDLLSKSRIVVDVSSSRQTGLSMRIIEALALKKKIFTANGYIVNEPFYNSRNICIFDPDSIVFDDDFINNNFEGESNVLSINEWIMAILGK